ncbi:MAG: response regulator [Bdellovibrionales bacterium]|nr:response regulator [Bdellovibrionales bacterium]
MKALVVDDSSATRFILAKMLSELGFEVVDAENGQVGLDKLGANRDVALALVDWNMPVMNGYELIQAIRAKEQFNSVKIMMVTTETEMAQVVKAMEAGADEYIMKPFTKNVVLEKMKLLGISK